MVRRKNICNWLRDRINGVLDNIIANLIVAGLVFILTWIGIIAQLVNWPVATSYIFRIAIVIGIIALVFLIQRIIKIRATKSKIHKTLISPPKEFVGRKNELDLFQNFLKYPNVQLVLSIHGPPGIGKSWLLNRFAYDAAYHKVCWAKVDFRNTAFESLQILYEIHKQLGESNFKHFQQAYDNYTRTRQDIISQGIDLLSDQNTFLVIREQEAIEAFTADYIKLANHRRIVLIFDTFENVDSAELGIWLEEVLKPLLFSYRFSTSAFIFGGWNSLKWHDGWESVIKISKLNYFTENEVLERLKIEIGTQVDPSLVSDIYKYTKGHPLAVGLASTLMGEAKRSGHQVNTKLFKDQTHDLEDKLITEFLIERILQRINPSTSHLVRCCALPRWFDADIANLFGIEKRQSQDLFDDLISYRAFIQPHFPIGYEYHEIVRQLIIRQWKRDNNQEYLKLNKLIFDKLIEIRQNVDDAIRDKITLDIIYHGFIVNEELGISTFRTFFKESLNLFRLDFCETMIREINSQNIINNKYTLEIEFRNAQVLLARELWHSAEEKLKEITSATFELTKGSDDQQLVAMIYFELGNCEARRSRNIQAVELFKTSLFYLNGQLNDNEFTPMDILIELGMALLVLGQLKEAEESLTEAETYSSFYPQKNSKLFLNFQVLYLAQGKWQSVLDYHKKFEQLPHNDKNEVDRMRESHHYAEVMERTGYFSQAMALYKENYKRAQQLRNPFRQMFAQQGIARVFEDMGHWEYALEKFQEALILEKELGGKLAAISYQAEEGRVQFKAGNYKEAEIIFNSSFNASEELGHTRLVAEINSYLGAINAIKGDFALSMENFTDALSILKVHEYFYQEAQVIELLLEYGGKYLEINSFYAYLSRGKLLSEEHNYYDIYAKLLFIEGNNILNSKNIDEPNHILELFNQACLYAMSYNFYLFEYVIDVICRSLRLSNHRDEALIIAENLINLWSKRPIMSSMDQTQNDDSVKIVHLDGFISKLRNTIQEIESM